MADGKREMRDMRVVNLRALAILLVMLGHSIILYSPEWTLYTTDVRCRPFELLKNLINLIQMPLFFSLSGFLFSGTVRRKPLSVIAMDKAKRLLVPFFAFALLWMLPVRWLIGYGGYRQQPLTETTAGILTGPDSGHLWYLPVLFLCFVFFGTAVKLWRKLGAPEAAGAAGMALLSLAAMLRPTPVTWTYAYNLCLHAFWFWMGWMLGEYSTLLKALRRTAWRRVLLAALTLALLALAVLRTNTATLLACRLALLLSAYALAPAAENELLNRISKASFGMYLFHSPLVYITFAYGSGLPPLMVLLINFVLFGFLAYALAEMLRRSKLRMLAGE